VKKSEQATLYLRTVEIELYCTDPLFVNPLLAALADQIGYYGFSAYKLPSGTARDDKAFSIEAPLRDVYCWRLYGIDERLEDAWWLIVQRFSECGWELLGKPSLSREHPRGVLCFSLEGAAGRTETLAEGQRRKATEEPIRRRAGIGASGL
jgi:hypothetical protein